MKLLSCILRAAETFAGRVHGKMQRYRDSRFGPRKRSNLTIGRAYESGWKGYDAVFVLSTGRTGTATLARLLGLSSAVQAEHEAIRQLVKASFDAYMDTSPNGKGKWSRVLPGPIRAYVRKKWYELRTGPPLFHRLFRPSQLPEIVSFDKAFPQAKKRHRRAAYRVPTPEASTALGQNDVVHLDRSQYTVPDDYVSVVSDVLVCSTNEVVLTDDRKIVRESSTAKRLKYFNTRPFYTSPEQSIEGYVFLLRSRFHNYYHLLLDALPRLLALTRPPFNQIEQIKLLCPGGLTHTEQFFLSKLDIDHVKPLIVPESNVLYRAEHLIFTPLKTEMGAGYLPPFYKNQLRERLHPNRPSRSSRRFFISREKAQRRSPASARSRWTSGNASPCGFSAAGAETGAKCIASGSMIYGRRAPPTLTCKMEMSFSSKRVNGAGYLASSLFPPS